MTIDNGGKTIRPHLAIIGITCLARDSSQRAFYSINHSLQSIKCIIIKSEIYRLRSESKIKFIFVFCSGGRSSTPGLYLS